MTRNDRDSEIFGGTGCRKNSILGINNVLVDPKPEPNVQKEFFHRLSIF